jgi:hypothetical protein
MSRGHRNPGIGAEAVANAESLNVEGWMGGPNVEGKAGLILRF